MSRGGVFGNSRPTRQEGGFVTVEFMVAVGFSFLLLVMVTNLVIVQYGRGIVRASVDEAARAGARISSDPVASCTRRAENVMEGIGNLASGVEIDCRVVDGQITANTSADFEGWLPFVPDFTENAVASVARTQAPQ